jgi:hypothetical protein
MLPLLHARNRLRYDAKHTDRYANSYGIIPGANTDSDDPTSGEGNPALLDTSLVPLLHQTLHLHQKVASTKAQ